jgi:hypothetical protein
MHLQVRGFLGAAGTLVRPVDSGDPDQFRSLVSAHPGDWLVVPVFVPAVLPFRCLWCLLFGLHRAGRPVPSRLDAFSLVLYLPVVNPFWLRIIWIYLDMPENRQKQGKTGKSALKRPILILRRGERQTG